MRSDAQKEGDGDRWEHLHKCLKEQQAADTDIKKKQI